MMMAPNVAIYLSSNSSLELSNCHLFTCLLNTAMWSGIVVNGTNNSLYLDHNTLIEDANQAVTISNGGTPASGFNYVFSSDGATFNRNTAGVVVVNESIAEVRDRADCGIAPKVHRYHRRCCRAAG